MAFKQSDSSNACPCSFMFFGKKK